MAEIIVMGKTNHFYDMLFASSLCGILAWVFALAGVVAYSEAAGEKISGVPAFGFLVCGLFFVVEFLYSLPRLYEG